MSQMRSEALQAPQAVARLLAQDEALCAAIGRSLRDEPPTGVLTVARGSSDHAAQYFAYLVMARLGRLVTSLPMSLVTLYPARLQRQGVLAVAFSQSGRSPDLIAPMTYFGEGGARSALRKVPEGKGESLRIEELKKITGTRINGKDRVNTLEDNVKEIWRQIGGQT